MFEFQKIVISKKILFFGEILPDYCQMSNLYTVEYKQKNLNKFEREIWKLFSKNSILHFTELMLWVVGLYLKITKNVMHFIHKDEFCFIHMPFGSMVIFQLICTIPNGSLFPIIRT